MITFFKGRVALYAILKAIGIKPGDEVILPGFTCVVVPNAIVYLGAKPIYVDIDPTNYNIDPNKIEEKITGRTKVIIAQHTFGIPADMDRITEIAKRLNLYVVEDSCHAIGSKYRGRTVGSFGDAAFFSSQWSKPVTTGLGGWSIINSETLLPALSKSYEEFAEPSLRESVLLYFQYLFYRAFFKSGLFWPMQDLYRYLSERGIVIGSSSGEELECKMPPGYKKKMTRWQNAVLQEKLKRISSVINHRKWVASRYEDELRKRHFKIPTVPSFLEPVYLRYPIQVNDKTRLLLDARGKRLEIGDWFLSPVHPILGMWDRVGYKTGMCPKSEAVCHSVVDLPTHEGINEREIEKIIALVTPYGLSS